MNNTYNLGNSNASKVGRLKSTMLFDPPLCTCALEVGDNGTPAASNFRLLGILSNNYFDVLSQTTSYEPDFTGVYAIITRVLRNKTTKPVTIREIGLYVKGDVNNTTFMIAREVLDEPVTMQPGEKHSFTLSLGID